ncbi:hypothetical protein GCM10022282_13510 [Agromyces indicus]
MRIWQASREAEAYRQRLREEESRSAEYAAQVVELQGMLIDQELGAAGVDPTQVPAQVREGFVDASSGRIAWEQIRAEVARHAAAAAADVGGRS